MTHELKTWPEPFSAILRGNKRHEVRVNDRGFNEGDVLHLREWDPDTKQYTRDGVFMVVTYISRGFGLPENLVCMSIHPMR